MEFDIVPQTNDEELVYFFELVEPIILAIYTVLDKVIRLVRMGFAGWSIAA